MAASAVARAFRAASSDRHWEAPSFQFKLYAYSMAEEVDFLGNLGVRTGDKLLFEGDGQGVSAASSKQEHFPNFAALATPESRWAERAMTNGCAGYVNVDNDHGLRYSCGCCLVE